MNTRVLVVDDEPVVRRLMARVLELEGFEAVQVGSVHDALVLPGPWGLLLLDRMLPNGDGQAVAAAWPGVPAITTSGYEPSDLPKPFTAAQLLTAVRAKLGTSG